MSKSPKVFDRLTLIADLGEFWIMKCSCGEVVKKPGRSVRSGRIRSCGCMNRELKIQRNTKHGLMIRGSKHPLYDIWHAMIFRCVNPKSKDWHLYGGRGINVCDRWRKDFSAFVADVGDRPSKKHTLDRKNNDGNYEPSNVRWATMKDQCVTRRHRSCWKRRSR